MVEGGRKEDRMEKQGTSDLEGELQASLQAHAMQTESESLVRTVS